MPTLAWPAALLLLALPWLAVRWPAWPDARPVLRMPGRPASGAVGRFAGFGGRRWPTALAAFIWLCLVLALARPLWPEEVPVAGEPAPPGLLLVLDISASMDAEDLLLHGQPASRLTVAKTIAAELIQSLPAYRVGLVVFGSAAHVHTPLTRDKAALLAGLVALPSGLAGRGSALDAALALAASRIGEPGDGRPLMIVLSDGGVRQGRQIADESPHFVPLGGVKIHTLLVAAGRPAANAGLVESDPAPLEALAERTGGAFARVTESEALRAFLASIRQAERTARSPAMTTRWRELYAWPLALALALSAGLGVYLARRRGG